MKKIADVAKSLNISRQALYKKIKLDPYNKHTKKIKGALHISNEGIALIRASLSKPKLTPSLQQDSKQVELLSNQVKSKDLEIEFLRNQVNKLDKLIEQQQILTLNAQSRNKELEEPGIRKLSWRERLKGKSII